ncbi:MAG: GNAT family N-acetyltransferase [Alphaproteobacteria bacterium]|nr:GNAT family N-acetyltransferase [Alphaproteobacteria bacterium]
MKDLFEIKIVLSQKEFDDAMSVRRAVFVDEQNIAEELEFDGNDFTATHAVAYVGKKPVGAMRIRYFKDFVKLERACVLKDFRKTNIAEFLMDSVLRFCAQKGFEVAHGICKKELLPRWQQQGFFAIEGAMPVEQNGMTLIPIERKIVPSDEKIKIQTSVDILNKKEGQWFENAQVGAAAKLERKKQIGRFQAMQKKVEGLKLARNGDINVWRAPLKYDFWDVLEGKTDDKTV